MKKRWIPLLLALLLLPCLALAELNLTDMCGRDFTLDAPATRIVALNPGDCELIYAIGAEDTLVGRGSWCDYPEAVNALPVLNSGSETNIEEILALNPQVIVMTKMAQTLDHIAALENAGIVVVVSDAQTIEGVYEAARLLGSITGRDEAADKLVTSMQAELADLQKAAGEAKQRVYFEISPLQYGLWTSGPGTFMDEIGSMLGLENIFGDVGSQWAEVSQEQVLQRDPQVIITTAGHYEGGPSPSQEIMGRPGWQNLQAVLNQRIYEADNDAFTRPGPRLVEGARDLYRFLYQE